MPDPHRLFCLFTFSFIRSPSLPAPAPAVSEGVGRGDVKGYRAAISEMETWHFLSLTPSLRSLFILSDIPRMRGRPRPGRGWKGREGEGESHPNLPTPPVDRYVSEWASFKTFWAGGKIGSENLPEHCGFIILHRLHRREGILRRRAIGHFVMHPPRIQISYPPLHWTLKDTLIGTADRP